MTRTRSLYASAIAAAALAVSLLAGATGPLLGSTLDVGSEAAGSTANGPIGLAGRGAGCDACDVNCDGAVDGRDIQAFAAALLGAPSAGCSPCAGDVDGSGGVTVADFGGLVDCLLVANQAFVQGGCLHVIGSDAAGSLALRLRAGLPTMLDVDFGNDGVVEFSFDRSQFDCIEVEGRGGDDVIVIDEQNGVFTDTEITTIDGGSGNDLLFGGSGGETFVGGPGNDSAFMGAGNDRFIWNPGDDTDLVEGADGIDTVEVNGSDGSEDFTITANGTRVRLDRVSPAAFFLDIGTCENLLLNAHGGNDTLSCVGNLAALIQITADGGPGNDTLLGSNGADVLIGGDDNDFIDGNQGNDTVLLGAGNDTFQWDPGDGSDIVEGQGGYDVVVFNGSNANENMAFSANGSRLRFTRDVGNIVMDIAGVEQFDLRALGGTDNVTASNLSGTGVTQVNVDLGATGGVGDAQADNVTIIGTAGADAFNVFASSGFTVVNVGADIRVKGYEFGDQLVFNGVGGDVVSVNGSSGADTMTVVANGTQARVDATGYSAGVAVSGALSLVVNGLGGPDNISCTGNLAGLLIPLTLDGGPGDDVILGSNGADVLIGGDDNDFVDGNQGNDTALLGPGDDTFNWDPGDGSDTIEGQDGHDVLLFNGSNASEIMDLSANGQRLRLTRNVGNIVMDTNDVEQINLQALGGVDAVTTNDLSATDVTLVNIDLGATGGVGDAQPDTVTVNGTNLPDTILVGANAGAVEVSGLAAFVRITHPEAANDTLIVNGLGGADTITPGPGVTALIMLTLNP